MGLHEIGVYNSRIVLLVVMDLFSISNCEEKFVCYLSQSKGGKKEVKNKRGTLYGSFG